MIPGTALAVRHIPRVRPRPNGRMAVECSCHPDVALAVQKASVWTGGMVLDVEAQHVAAVERHIALVSRQRGRSWGHHALARKVQEVGSDV